MYNGIKMFIMTRATFIKDYPSYYNNMLIQLYAGKNRMIKKNCLKLKGNILFLVFP